MQKRASGGAAVPQRRQLRSSLAPHDMQNCAAGGFSTAQAPQVRAVSMVSK
jgi:hypothetical protein